MTHIGFKMIEDKGYDKITLPFSLLDNIEPTNAMDRKIMEKWMTYFKEKREPYYILQENDTGIYKLYVQQTATIIKD